MNIFQGWLTALTQEGKGMCSGKDCVMRLFECLGANSIE